MLRADVRFVGESGFLHHFKAPWIGSHDCTNLENPSEDLINLREGFPRISAFVFSLPRRVNLEGWMLRGSLIGT